MRWRFIEGGPDLEARDDTVDAMDSWWSEFAARADDLNAMFGGGAAFDLVEWMKTGLGRVHPDLMWEYGPAVDQPGHRLVITPEHRYELTEMTRTLVGRAPAIEGWEFYPGRLPETPEHAAQMVESRTGGSLDGVTVSITPGSDRLIDLHYVSTSPTAEHDAFVATETLLGEAVLNTWVGAVTAGRPKRGLFSRSGPDAVPVGEFPPALDSVRRTILGSGRASPFHEWVADTEWSLFQLQPKAGDDFAGTADLAVAVAASADLWKATHGATRFASERFSRQGERFVYVKIDGSEGLDGSVFEGRDDIEDALTAVLTPAGLGCVVGGGTGLRYSYIDLALTDLDGGLAAVQTCLESGRIPNRTWILFYDRVWSDEWIGIYPTTPPPPPGSADSSGGSS
ncbi:MAG: hypothetical protein OEO77_07030 [Acidimicrobiia bacterium]|nr:hypothetical protein [Acidimicrobiia bacterium]